MADPIQGTDQGETISAFDPTGVIVYGHGGDDIINTGDGDDEVYGGSGDDWISLRQGNNIAFGDSGNDEIRGGAARDILFGGDGDDRLMGGVGGGDDDLYGGDGNDRLSGTMGNDRIWGGPGDDTIFGGTQGNDILYGDAGDDTIWGGGRQLPSLQHIYGGDGKDHLIGDDGDDVIFGGADGDLVWGSHHRDICYGGSGRDSVHGNYGDDLLYGDSGKDKLYGAQASDVVYGGSGNDRVSGSGGKDWLYGGPGNDRVFGNKDDDVLAPGTGRDRVDGHSGVNTLSYEDVNASVRISIPNKKYKGEAGNDDIRNVDNLIGSQKGDELKPTKDGYAYGEGGSDVIKSAGSSKMRGDEGNDRLVGGKNKDIFWLQDPDEFGADTIVRFQSKDKLRLDGSDFGFGGSLSGDELVNRDSGHAPSGSDAQLIYDQDSKTLWFDSDGIGSDGAVQVAKFKGGPGSLSGNDFDII